MLIGNERILPGERHCINLPIAMLPIRTPVTLPISVFRAHEPGPVLLLLGGIHGNELTGIEVLRRLIAEARLMPEAGSVIAIPLVNPHGFLHRSRELPDGRDLNRNFPGSKEGSLASQLARVLMKEVLVHADVAIDLHSGGLGRHNIPQVRCHLENPAEVALAEVFGCDFIVNSGYREKSFRENASKKGIPTLVYEAGEAQRLNDDAIEHGITGIERVMAHLGMRATAPAATKNDAVRIVSSSWQRAALSGLFRSKVCAGAHVRKHQVIGSVSDPFGDMEKPVKARMDGYVIGMAKQPVINKGDALFHLGVADAPQNA